MPLYEKFQIPKDGSLSLWLDDERPAPNNWIAIKTPWDFINILDDKEISGNITRMSLDWYLGAGVDNGEKVASKISNRIRSNPDFLPSIKEVFNHSSDRDKARSMAIMINDAFASVGRDVRVRIRTSQTTSKNISGYDRKKHSNGDIIF